MIGVICRLWRRPAVVEPSTFHKILAVHIAEITRSAGRRWWPRSANYWLNEPPAP